MVQKLVYNSNSEVSHYTNLNRRLEVLLLIESLVQQFHDLNGIKKEKVTKGDYTDDTTVGRHRDDDLKKKGQ